jgi:hypothetical protein
MVKFLKPGRVVVVLFGRYAGKKAIIVKLFEEGTKDRKFPHVLVAGLSRQPMMVRGPPRRSPARARADADALHRVAGLARNASEEDPQALARPSLPQVRQPQPHHGEFRSRPLSSASPPRAAAHSPRAPQPTRYSVDIDVKSVLSPKSLNEAGALRESMLEVRKLFQSRYLNRGKNTTGVQYFYQKLRF